MHQSSQIFQQYHESSLVTPLALYSGRRERGNHYKCVSGCGMDSEKGVAKEAMRALGIGRIGSGVWQEWIGPRNTSKEWQWGCGSDVNECATWKSQHRDLGGGLSR
ncbi:uncharacterized protein MELLADRAFT_102247 [Melampsora larici-populina 98AG31]|uniref:Uncharacterized protein n=1 Tax=Melampsora larici-populina (strain 98AG31 / pathotype 3-4-7) TaxID=747676 RepID=F4R7N7_MELLP|nr:uncharacterized protein MELLADRAFT_102247 [Melampsora larici-populina 98AG31]EGG11348.1 hypothetical protein MELLADRAFT_102247 [Melampsora larici-populina 98AG31]